MSKDVVTLLIGTSGVEFGGWKTARVTRSIESLSGSFELGVSERWAAQDQPWPVQDGDPCTVLVNGEPLITGYVDDRDPSFEGVSVSGRDKAADMVDCSAILDHWSFKGVNVLELVQQLADPYGIEVSLQPGLVIPPTSLPKKFDINPGDTSHSALENVCRVAGVLAVSDGLGGVVLTRAGRERCKVDLVQGVNILPGARAKFSMKDRFRTYLVLGQHKGNDDFSGEGSAAVRGEAADPNVRSTRTLVIRPEGNVTPAQAKKRAEWEAITRAARSATVSIPVQGWTQGDKARTLWPINKLVRVDAPRLGVRGDMLITAATYSLDVSGGTVTTLELKRPDAFLSLPANTVSGDGLWKEIRRGALT